MLVHGGYSTEGKITLSDYNIFDIEENQWVKCVIGLNEESSGIGERSNHTMQAIYDSDLYDRIYVNERVNQKGIRNRKMWV